MSKVLVIGAARSGVAAAKLLLNHGYSVVLTDNRKEEDIKKEFPMIIDDFNNLVKGKDNSLELLFGEQISPARLKEFDFIVPSPGVPETIPIIVKADDEEVPIYSEPELSYQLSNTPFIAITGTNGKTTTTTLVGEIFKNAGADSYVVGNIGDAICNYVDKTNENSVFVTEIGSFQLDRTSTFKPKGALILNITPDHLDRHKTMENYINAKAKIFRNQDANDFLVLNDDDLNTRDLAKDSEVKKLYISLDHSVPNGAYLEDNVLKISNNNEIIDVISADDLGIKGKHNIQNALGAILLAYHYGIPLDVIQSTLKEFKGVEHRQEIVATIDGTTYINDSKGTNTDAAIIALDAMIKPVHLIAGGYDKREDYTKFSKKVKEKVKKVYLLGKTAHDISKSLDENGFKNYEIFSTFEEAVNKAKEESGADEIVLLSPACASWDMFDNFEQRGQLFKDLVLAK